MESWATARQAVAYLRRGAIRTQRGAIVRVRDGEHRHMFVIRPELVRPVLGRRPRKPIL